eukprot:gene3267-22133_t
MVKIGKEKPCCDRLLGPCISCLEVRMNKWGLDPDDVLAYSTTKKVLVRDAKVGVIYFTTIICVILYIIVIAIVNDRGFVVTEQVTEGALEIRVMDAWEISPKDWGFPEGMGLPQGCKSGRCGRNTRNQMNNSNLKMNYDDFGEMRSANNTVVKEFQKGNYDYISIDELLSAAGLDAYGGLDGPHFSSLLENPNNSSFRHLGMNIVIEVEYANHFSDPEETIKYVYRPRLVPGLDNTVIERRYSEIGDKRQKILRSGIGIEVVFTGTFEKFSFITLMGTIVAGLALVGGTNLALDFFLTHFLRDKDIYKSHLYATTEDFSVYRDGMSVEERAAHRKL